MFVERIKTIYKPGKPIFSEDIILLFPEFTRAYIFRLLKRALNNGEIIQYSRGVYYLPKKSYFGISSLTPSMISNAKYVTDNKSVYGIYSGLSLLNQFAISSQVPNTLEIVTNKEATRKRVVDIDGMKFILRKSRFEINNDNYDYYTILQLFSELGVNYQISDVSKQMIKDYIVKNNIQQNELIGLAMKFPAQTIKNLIGSGVLNGTI